MENARVFTFESYCRIHQVSRLAVLESDTSICCSTCSSKAIQIA